MSPLPPLLPRLASVAVERAMRTMPVVVLMGSRQTGKSTLARTGWVDDDRPYVTLDDLDARAGARDAPDDLVRRAPRLVLDEVQREPDVVPALKRAVDEDTPRRAGRFLLTGSANLLLMERISDSLAGRAGYVTLRPLTRRERLGRGAAGIWSDLLELAFPDWYDRVRAEDAPGGSWRELARVGGYPTPAHELSDAEARGEWFRGFIRSYLERDLQDLAAIQNQVDFRRLMRVAALRIGGVVNQADMARDAGSSRATFHRHLNLLETSFQVVRVEPYSVNRTKRLVKAPKLYWSDTGLAMAVAGEEEPRGAHLENLVLGDLLAWRDALEPDAQVLYWRTYEGEEVDFVIESGGRLLAVEVKASSRVRPADVRHLRTFRDQYGDAVHGALVLYDGDEVFRVSEGILAAPWWKVI